MAAGKSWEQLSCLPNPPFTLPPIIRPSCSSAVIGFLSPNLWLTLLGITLLVQHVRDHGGSDSVLPPRCFAFHLTKDNGSSPSVSGHLICGLIFPGRCQQLVDPESGSHFAVEPSLVASRRGVGSQGCPRPWGPPTSLFPAPLSLTLPSYSSIGCGFGSPIVSSLSLLSCVGSLSPSSVPPSSCLPLTHQAPSLSLASCQCVKIGLGLSLLFIISKHLPRGGDTVRDIKNSWKSVESWNI